MNQKEWYAKLEKWAFDDARLHRLPLALLPVLAEHLANHDAAEQNAHTDGATVCAKCGYHANYPVCTNCGTAIPAPQVA